MRVLAFHRRRQPKARLELLHGLDVGGLDVLLEIGGEALLEVVEADELILNDDGHLKLLDSVSDGNCREGVSRWT